MPVYNAYVNKSSAFPLSLGLQQVVLQQKVSKFIANYSEIGS